MFNSDETPTGDRAHSQDQSSGSGMVRVRRQRTDPFSRVPHAILEDDRLSWRAKGIMAYLLGRPENWTIRMRDIQNRSKEGYKAVQKAMRELKSAGYAKLVPRIDCGRMAGTMWEVTDISVLDEASPDNAFFVQSETDRSETGQHNKKKGTKKEGNKNQSKETKETPSRSEEGEPSFPSVWKPRPGDRESKLSRLRPPSSYPSETEFDSFLCSHGLDHIETYKFDLYSLLCQNKWHQWKPELRKWIRIRDWRAYVLALDLHIQDAC